MKNANKTKTSVARVQTKKKAVEFSYTIHLRAIFVSKYIHMTLTYIIHVTRTHTHTHSNHSHGVSAEEKNKTHVMETMVNDIEDHRRWKPKKRKKNNNHVENTITKQSSFRVTSKKISFENGSLLLVCVCV